MVQQLASLWLSLALVAGLFGAGPAPQGRMASVAWDGGAGTPNWNDAGNWTGDAVPGATDEVLLDNAFVAGSYAVNLPSGGVTVDIRRLTISPDVGNTITLVLPGGNISNPGLRVGDGVASTDDIVLANGAILKNASGGTTGPGVEVNSATNGTIRIGNGARYVHNTTRANAGLASRLSTSAGTEFGVFEFDVPGTGSYAISASGRSYGSLTLSGTIGSGNYSASGSNPLTVRGNFTVNTGATFDNAMTAPIYVVGMVTNDGTLKQTKTVSSNTEFLHITNSSGTDKYRGVDISTSNNLGPTTVAVSGNQVCQQANGFPVKRCFNITPTGLQSADITFYYQSSEMQTGQTAISLNVWNYRNGAWYEEDRGGDSGTCPVGAIDCWVEGTGISSYGPFALENTDPASVTLADFWAEQVGDYILLTWETATELNNRGFNLYRGMTSAEPDRQLNEHLIPSQSLGNPGGFIYTWDDHVDLAPGTTYFYWVEDVDVSGVATRHGPVEVAFNVPTSVTLSDMHTSPMGGAALPWPWAMAGAGVALGAAARRRRR